MRRKVFVSLAVTGAVAVLAALGTFAAFTATTTNSGNQISSGTVKIDQHAGSTSLYNASNKKPGEDTTGCVRVTYSGSLPAAIKLYSTAAITNGSAYNLKVERGSGLSSPGASMSCTGFNAGSTVYNATLSGFPSTFTGGSQGKNGGTAWAQNDQVDYRFTITPNDDTTANNHTTVQSTSPHDFTWDAKNYSGYPATVLQTPGLQSYWRLGESSGTTAFDTAPGGGINGTYTNGPTLGQPSLTSDAGDSAVTFHQTDYVNLGDSYDFTASSAYSVATWVTPSSEPSQYRNLAYKINPGSSGWKMFITGTSSGGPLRLGFERFNAGSYSSLVGSTTFNAGVRHFVVVTYDGTIQRLYIDGSLAQTNTPPQALPDTNVALRIGGDSANGLIGDLDDFSIYNRALTSAEVQAHYDVGK